MFRGALFVAKPGKMEYNTDSDRVIGEVEAMGATVINVVLILLGSIVGLLFRGKIPEKLIRAITCALGLCVLLIGIDAALETNDTLCVIVCMVVGTLLGEWIDIEGKMDKIGEALKAKVAMKGENARFSEGFVSASVLYCVGAMAINGSLAAGLRGDWSILVSKGVIDGVTSITFAATMGMGVLFSVIPLFLYQGGLTLLASVIGPYLSGELVAEMSAVGGVIIIGIAVNMLALGKERVRVGNMLPAIFLPAGYLFLAHWLGGLVG